MAISLKKGGNVSLSKEAPGLSKITVGLGWDSRVTDGAAFDLDGSVFLCGDDGKVIDDNHFIFYGNLKSQDGSVEHTGDNVTGEGDGDDEQVKIELNAVAAGIKKMVFSVTIHEAATRNQNFGQVANAFMRVIDQNGGKELARYDLSEDYSVETAMIFGEVYRHNDEWKFKAIGAGFEGGLGPLAKSMGVNVS